MKEFSQKLMWGTGKKGSLWTNLRWGPKREEWEGQKAEVGDTLGVTPGTSGIHELHDISQHLKPSRKCPESDDYFSVSQQQDTCMELLNMTFFT